MNALIEALVSRPRPVLLGLAVLIIWGTLSFVWIPKESEPDIPIPLMYVNVVHEGISPEDAERLLIRPMETELRTIEGLKEIRATASEGVAVLMLEFDAGFDSDQALTDVREKVDLARAELPADSEEPFVQEINIGLFPILVVMLHGDVPERTLVAVARELRDDLEALQGVLTAEIAGDREELLEVVVDPARLESYSLGYEDIFNYVSRNNRLVAAGALDSGQGRFAVKVPGVFEDLDDLFELPIKTDGAKTVTFRDVATVRRTFKDPTGFARLDGERAIAIEISKRSGSNILEVVDSIRATVAEAQTLWPEAIQVTFTQDNSEDVRTMLSDLANNVAMAIILVMIVTLGTLGTRSAGLVGLSIPGAFLTGILAIYLLGYSMNIVVLFSLIMAVGMLVDGATIVIELADRNLGYGYPRSRAYVMAAKRMAWPVISSTGTTLAVFIPLMFWPGLIGEFMKYLPITLLLTLSASIAMAIFFVPAAGSIFGGKPHPTAAMTALPHDPDSDATVLAEARQSLAEVSPVTRAYIGFLTRCLAHPVRVVITAFTLLTGVFVAYELFGRGTEFFPEIEPTQAALNIHARGDLSVQERDALVRDVEERILDMPELETVYARSGLGLGNDVDEDIVGRIQMRFIDWELRRPAEEILDEVRARTADLPGIIVEPQAQESGITEGKPIQIELSSRQPDLLPAAVAKLRAAVESLNGVIDITDSRPMPGIDWRLEVDRMQAAKFGLDITTVGSAIQLITNGIMIGEYRPNDADDEVDIRVRFPESDRNISQLDRLTVNTPQGAVPISNFMDREAAPRVGDLERTDGERVMTIAAGVEDDVLSDDKIGEIQRWLASAEWDPAVDVVFRGESEDQAEAEAFLQKAFMVGLFLITVILVTQFNGFYQTLLILSAVVFSTIGVLIGLLVTDQPFGVVMCGIGVISLAGIVVSNNIVLIDTYNIIRKAGAPAVEAAILTCAQRLRPVMLTTVTTILGLLPLAFALNFDLINRHTEVGGPSTQWWTQLSTAITGGLTFATLLTLVMTPCLLVLGEQVVAWWRTRYQARFSSAAASTPTP